MGVTPQALLDKPVTRPEDDYYLRIFYDLSGSRQLGEVPGAIPLSEYSAYCTLWDITESAEKERLVSVVRRLDSEYQNYAYEKSKHQREKQSMK